MAYIMTYEDYHINYYDIDAVDREYSVGRNTKDISNDIPYHSGTISREKGIASVTFGVLYYRNSDRQVVPVPTYLNNRDIFKEEISFEHCDVLAFPLDNYKFAYMMYVEQKNWAYYRLTGQNFNISILGDEIIVFSESTDAILEFRFIGQNYYVTSPGTMDKKAFILNDDLDDPYAEEAEKITKSIRIDYKHVYRIIYENYLFVIGGDIILYGRI